MDDPTGGPAFPFTTENGANSGDVGMTLRDYFSSHADVRAYSPFEAYKAARGKSPTIGELADYIAEIRMIEADAMLQARKL